MLDEFFVAEGLRGKGIGAEALAFAAEWCRGRRLEALRQPSRGKGRLEVDPQNRRGQKLYRRSSFLFTRLISWR